MSRALWWVMNGRAEAPPGMLWSMGVFHVAVLVEVGAHGVEHLCALDEDVLHAVVYHKVDVAAAVAQFGVLEAVVGHAVLHLYDGKRTQALAQQSERGCVHGNLTRLCAVHVTLHADEVADVEELLEYHVVEVLVFAGAELVAVDIYLDTAVGVLQFHKGGFTHYTAAHYAAGYAHAARRRGVGKGIPFGVDGNVGEVGFYFVGMTRHNVFSCGVGVDTHGTELFERLTANGFLLAEFKWIHNL